MGRRLSVNNDPAQLAKFTTSRLRRKRFVASANDRMDVVERIDKILMRRAHGERSLAQISGPPFRPYKIRSGQDPLMRYLWQHCNDHKISRTQLAKRSGFSDQTIINWVQVKNVPSLPNAIALFEAAGLELSVRPASHDCASPTASEGC